MKSKKPSALACPFDNIRASAHPMVAFSAFYESHKPPPSGDALGIVPKRPSKWVHITSLFCLLSPWRLPRRYGARVARWQRPVASGVALDMLHQAMPHVSLQHLHMVIEMSSDGGAFVGRLRLFRLA